MNTTVKTPVYHFATLASCCVLLVYRKQEYGIFKRYISFFPRFKFGLTGRGARGGGGGGVHPNITNTGMCRQTGS